MADTLREQIIVELESRFKNQRSGSPTADPYQHQWDVVSRNNLDGDQFKLKRAVLGIYDTEERKDPKIQQTDATLRLVLEFRVLAEKEENPSTLGNCVIGEIIRQLRSDIYTTQTGTTTQLTLDIQEQGNELDISGSNDKQVRGAVFANVLYRHAINDPRAVIGSLQS